MKYKPPIPDVQIAFCQQLFALKGSHLQQALLDTLSDADISIVDKELAMFVKRKDLQFLARRGLEES